MPETESASDRYGWRRLAVGVVLAASAAGAALLIIDDPLSARAAALAAAALVLWLSETVPPFVPTFALLAAAPVVLGGFGPAYAPRAVATWAIDPVLGLFLGGFAMGSALARHGLDAAVAAYVVRHARGRRSALVALVLGAAAFLSMWMSNTAAAAMLLAALAPVLASADAPLRRGLLLALAMGANFGGMATPIGTGPNAIALAALPPGTTVSFGHWMAFAVPLAAMALAVTWLLIRLLHPAACQGAFIAPAAERPQRTGGARAVIALAVLAVAGWLGEPWHGVPAAVVSLALATALFAGGLLRPRDLGLIDWSTLLLIAGGLALGRLLEQAGLVGALTGQLHAAGIAPTTAVVALVLLTACLSAVMSNTATATMLVPVAAQLDPASPALPILIALGASFGMPFAISTPPNAMVVGAGLRGRELLVPGVTVMIGGSVLLALTGPAVLRWFGIG